MWSWRGTRDAALATALTVSLYLNIEQAAQAERLAVRLRDIRDNCLVIRMEGVREDHRRELYEIIREAMDSLHSQTSDPQSRSPGR